MNTPYLVFIDEMKKHGNPANAYRAAYPEAAKGSAYYHAQKLMQVPEIAAAIKDVTITKAVRIPEREAQRKIFLKEYLRLADHVKAYTIAFPKNKNPKQRAARLLNSAWVQEHIKAVKTQTEELFAQEAAEERQLIFFTYAEKRDLLKRIALGQVMTRKNIFINGEWTLADMPASIDERMRAIDLENRMTGDYSPDKLELNQKFDGFVINISGDGWAEQF